jgi:hypothetical protein
VPPTGGKSLGQAFTDATCTATLTALPPANSVIGNHQVFGFFPLNDGSPAPGRSASHNYMIDPAAAATPTPQASAATSTQATAVSVASYPARTRHRFGAAGDQRLWASG